MQIYNFINETKTFYQGDFLKYHTKIPKVYWIFFLSKMKSVSVRELLIFKDEPYFSIAKSKLNFEENVPFNIGITYNFPYAIENIPTIVNKKTFLSVVENYKDKEFVKACLDNYPGDFENKDLKILLNAKVNFEVLISCIKKTKNFIPFSKMDYLVIEYGNWGLIKYCV